MQDIYNPWSVLKCVKYKYEIECSENVSKDELFDINLYTYKNFDIC